MRGIRLILGLAVLLPCLLIAEPETPAVSASAAVQTADPAARGAEALKMYCTVLIPQYADAWKASASLWNERMKLQVQEAKRWGVSREAFAKFGYTGYEDLLVNAVFPPVSMREPLVDWWPVLRPLAQRLAKEAKTPLEAAQAINRALSKETGVVYSTKRDVANQDPLHSMRIGLASCTGITILCVDACRSIGIPARPVGCMWRNKAGNHTWMEVWSEGRWHSLDGFFGGAPGTCWYMDDAMFALKEDPRYAIYATCMKPMPDPTLKPAVGQPPFPVFYGWAVPAENVTARYLRPGKGESVPGIDRVYLAAESAPGERVEVQVTYADKIYTTPGPLRDMNDFLTLEVPAGKPFTVTVGNREHTFTAKPYGVFVLPVKPKAIR